MIVGSNGSTSGPAEDEVMSTINITPFTDVLLVLLIIFIILASVTKEPKLPDAKNVLKVQPSEIVVTINEKSQVSVGSNDDVQFSELPRRRSRRFKIKPTISSRA